MAVSIERLQTDFYDLINADKANEGSFAFYVGRLSTLYHNLRLNPQIAPEFISKNGVRLKKLIDDILKEEDEIIGYVYEKDVHKKKGIILKRLPELAFHIEKLNGTVNDKKAAIETITETTVRQKTYTTPIKAQFEHLEAALPLFEANVNFQKILDARQRKEEAAKQGRWGLSFSKTHPDKKSRTHEDRQFQNDFLQEIGKQIHQAMDNKRLSTEQGKLAVKGALWILKEQLKLPKQKGLFGSDLEKEIDRQLLKLGANPKKPELNAIRLCVKEMDIMDKNAIPPEYFGRLNKVAAKLKSDLIGSKLLQELIGNLTQEDITKLEDNGNVTINMKKTLTMKNRHDLLVDLQNKYGVTPIIPKEKESANQITISILHSKTSLSRLRDDIPPPKPKIGRS